MGSRDLSHFPRRNMGTYMDFSDSSVYIIQPRVILERHQVMVAENEDSLAKEDGVKLCGDSLLLTDLELWYPVDRRNDSVFGQVVIYDTVFWISQENRLRKMKKDYFLNFRNDSLWMVLKLNFDRNGGAYLYEVDKEEMEVFEQVCRVEVETNSDGKPRKYILSPTKKELRQLMQLRTFTDTSVYSLIDQEELR
jgi:hypothetical protein